MKDVQQVESKMAKLALHHITNESTIKAACCQREDQDTNVTKAWRKQGRKKEEEEKVIVQNQAKSDT
jgi:hypothetical protein